MIILFGWALACGAKSEPAAFDRYVNDSPELWKLTRSSWLDGETAGWFRPTSDSPDGDLRYPGYSHSPQVSFLGFRVYEIILAFQTNAMKGITLSLFNRGDAGEISSGDFAGLTESIASAISSWSGQKSKANPLQKLKSNIQVFSTTWILTNAFLEMKWSASKRAVLGQVPDNPFQDWEIKGFRAEYIQIIISPRSRRQASLNSAGAIFQANVSSTAIKKNVREDENGFITIDNIPMVDQGERGYCAVATAERLLKYYGKDIDQHTLAQMSDTRTGGGTTASGMFDTLRKMSAKFGIKVKPHIEITANNILALIDKYNLQARKEKKPPINPIQDNCIDVCEIYAAMDPDMLRRVRCERDQAGLKRFTADIAKCVDQGIPLAWSVMLGIVNETPVLPQARGGHIRIISGYNAALKEILYSDSWGAGHEHKTMSFSNAWAITTGLYSIDPRY